MPMHIRLIGNASSLPAGSSGASAPAATQFPSLQPEPAEMEQAAAARLAEAAARLRQVDPAQLQEQGMAHPEVQAAQETVVQVEDVRVRIRTWATLPGTGFLQPPACVHLAEAHGPEAAGAEAAGAKAPLEASHLCAACGLLFCPDCTPAPEAPCPRCRGGVIIPTGETPGPEIRNPELGDC